MKDFMNAIFSWMLVGVVSAVVHASIEKQKLTVGKLGGAALVGPALPVVIIIHQIKKNINVNTCLMNCGDENEQK